MKQPFLHFSLSCPYHSICLRPCTLIPLISVLCDQNLYILLLSDTIPLKSLLPFEITLILSLPNLSAKHTLCFFLTQSSWTIIVYESSHKKNLSSDKEFLLIWKFFFITYHFFHHYRSSFIKKKLGVET